MCISKTMVGMFIKLMFVAVCSHFYFPVTYSVNVLKRLECGKCLN